MDPNVPCAYALRCECTHLTDFMGVAIPTSLDEVLAQLEPTITLPCPDGFFAPYDFMEQPFLYSLIKTLTVLNLLAIAFFRWRYKLRSQGKPLPWMKAVYWLWAKLKPVIKGGYYRIKNRLTASPQVLPNGLTVEQDAEFRGVQLEGDWFYALAPHEVQPGGERKVGPVTAVRLYELGTLKRVGDSTLVWCPRLDNWTALREARATLIDEVASEITGKGPQARSRHGKKLAKRKLVKFRAKLLSEKGAHLESAEIAAAYKEIYRNPTSALYAAYPHIFPAYDPSVGISSLESIALDASAIMPKSVVRDAYPVDTNTDASPPPSPPWGASPRHPPHAAPGAPPGVPGPGNEEMRREVPRTSPRAPPSPPVLGSPPPSPPQPDFLAVAPPDPRADSVAAAADEPKPEPKADPKGEVVSADSVSAVDVSDPAMNLEQVV